MQLEQTRWQRQNRHCRQSQFRLMSRRPRRLYWLFRLFRLHWLPFRQPRRRQRRHCPLSQIHFRRRHRPHKLRTTQ